MKKYKRLKSFKRDDALSTNEMIKWNRVRNKFEHKCKLQGKGQCVPCLRYKLSQFIRVSRRLSKAVNRYLNKYEPSAK